jgi:hypothetical protein
MAAELAELLQAAQQKSQQKTQSVSPADAVRA